MRKTEVKIVYAGVDISQDIAPFLVSFAFTDNSNQADDLQITLSDRYGLWRGQWFPQLGDKIRAELVWHDNGRIASLKCGTFSVDTCDFNGPPDTLTIQAASLPVNDKIKNERNTKAWENVTLFQIAKSIAGKVGMTAMLETDDVTYDRIDQTQQSDIDFLFRTADREGISVKITNNTIVLFDDLKYESMPPVRTIQRGQSDIKSYSFSFSALDAAYGSCVVSYFDSTNNQTIEGRFQAPGTTGPTLKINERVSSIAEAERKARNYLRQHNKNAQKARLTLIGSPDIVQGVTVRLSGFGKFDDKYFVESAKHVVGSGGYETTVELRKVLGY